MKEETKMVRLSKDVHSKLKSMKETGNFPSMDSLVDNLIELSRKEGRLLRIYDGSVIIWSKML